MIENRLTFLWPCILSSRWVRSPPIPQVVDDIIDRDHFSYHLILNGLSTGSLLFPSKKNRSNEYTGYHLFSMCTFHSAESCSPQPKHSLNALEFFVFVRLVKVYKLTESIRGHGVTWRTDAWRASEEEEIWTTLEQEFMEGDNSNGISRNVEKGTYQWKWVVTMWIAGHEVGGGVDQ